MCASLFPNLKNHTKLANLYDHEGNLEINYPHDSDDFGRCLKFVNAVPEIRQRFNEVATLSREWSNLINHWSEIETLYNEKKFSETTNLIRECNNKPKMKK